MAKGELACLSNFSICHDVFGIHPIVLASEIIYMWERVKSIILVFGHK